MAQYDIINLGIYVYTFFFKMCFLFKTIENV